jgi:hypothetical protein
MAVATPTIPSTQLPSIRFESINPRRENTSMQATQSVAPRPGITAPDGDIGTIPRYPCEGASLIRLGAVCDTAGATLSCRVVFLDTLGAYVAVSGAVSFAADASALDAGQYLATPTPDAWFPIGGPSIFGIHVDAVSGGKWTLTPMAS